MATGHLTIDLDALAANWRALNTTSSETVETGAVVKADGYGLDSVRVARVLAAAGARKFFVAVAEEAIPLRDALGPTPEIHVFSGHCTGDTGLIEGLSLIPMINSVEQLTRHLEALPNHPFGLQLDSGMNRLGLEPAEWAAVRDLALAAGPTLVMSHLACADEPDHDMNPRQLTAFREMTDGLDVPRSLAATGGILLGPEYHFDVTRPGIGLYGGLPFDAARPVVTLDLPVIQTREIERDETVGYANSFTALKRMKVATVSGGYADGITRHLSGKGTLFAGETPCPILGRVSMDLIGVDVTHLDDVPDALTLLGPHQGVDDVADIAGTIGYEILTQLGPRYERSYRRGQSG